jgi:hypothetical protein
LREVDDIFPLKIRLNGFEELPHLGLVRGLQGAKHIFIEVLIRPILCGLHQVVDRDRIGLAESAQPNDQQQNREAQLSHGGKFDTAGSKSEGGNPKSDGHSYLTHSGMPNAANDHGNN